MKELILEVLSNSDKALSKEEIVSELNIEGAGNVKEALTILDELVDDFKVYVTNKHKFMLFEKTDLRYGPLVVNKKGFGFLDLPNTMEDIYIGYDNMNGAIDGDFIIAELITSSHSRKKEGKVIRVVKRTRDCFVGEYKVNRNGNGFVSIDDNRVKILIDIKKEDSLSCVTGHKVIVKTYKQVDDKKYLGRVIKILGHKDDPGIDILSVAYENKIEPDFTKEAMDELKDIPKVVRENDLLGRRDLRDKLIYTIDGADTKDIDDAISIEKLDNGNYLLGVHIADVSYYVRKGTALDNDAYARATSVYLANTVIPMLPHELSNGICSLNEGVDRLAITCEMEIDNNGKTVNYDIYESVIHSKKKMTYDSVNNYLENNIIDEGYEDFAENLTLMHHVSGLVRKMKNKRGYINFDAKEIKIVQDEYGHPIKIVKREQRTGELLIEDFMICANECVATHLSNMNLPSIYRIHEKPKEERIKSFNTFLNQLGIKVKGRLNNPTPAQISNLLDELKDRKEYKVLSDMLLRSMQKAVYSKDNVGHFGIASPCYSHFTSPIRRYPDTILHRLLRTYIFEGDMSLKTINYYEENLVYMAEHTSQKERNAVICEREVNDMKIAEYMEDHIDEVFEGTISGVMGFGIFVELENGVEGLVKISTLDGYYEYDESNLSLIKRGSKDKYTIGDSVTIKVVSASKQERTVDFEIYKEEVSNEENRSSQ